MMIHAPFTEEQVALLNRFQHAACMHPFTCPRHPYQGTEFILVATPEGWVCPETGCTYRETWAHDFAVDPEFLERCEHADG